MIMLKPKFTYTTEAEGNPSVPCVGVGWEPTPEELEELNLGVPVVVWFLGHSFPSMVVEVGGIFDIEDESV